MAKPAASTSKAPTAVPAAKKSQAFEIDDIFASKPKPAQSGTSTTTPTASAAAPAKPAVGAISSLPPTKSKKKKGKAKAVEPAEEAAAAAVEGGAVEGAVRKAPEVIADTSAAIDSYRVQAPPTLKRKAGDEGDKDAEEEERFMDSRGTNRRRTDDGLPIYDASELKIGLGGDTPECPFDCQCCRSPVYITKNDLPASLLELTRPLPAFVNAAAGF